MATVLPYGDITPMKRCNTSIMPTKETNVAQVQGFYWPRYVTLPVSSSPKSKTEKLKPVKVTRPRKNSFSRERQQIEACLKLLPKTPLDFNLDFDLLATTACAPESLNRDVQERQPQHSYAWNPVSRRDAPAVKKPVSRLIPDKTSRKHSRKNLRKVDKRPSCKGWVCAIMLSWISYTRLRYTCTLLHSLPGTGDVIQIERKTS